MFSLFFILIGCSNEDKGEQSDENVYFSLRAVEVVEDNLQVDVKGEVRSSEDTIYYKVEQGTEIILEEQAISLGTNREEWSAFEFEITLNDVQVNNEDVPFITFYTKANNQVVNPNYVPIEIKDS